MTLTGTDRGSGADGTSGSTYVFSPASTIAAGSTAVLTIAFDNSVFSGGNPYTAVQTVFDSDGNIWTHSRLTFNRDPGAVNAGCVLLITDMLLPNSLITSDTITIEFSVATVAKAYALHQIDASVGVVTFVGSGGAGGTGNSTITTASIPSGDLVIGASANEYGTAQTPTHDSDASNGSWSTAQYAEVGTTLAGINLAAQRKVVTGTGTQTYNVTYGTSTDWAIGWVSYTEVVAGGSEDVVPYIGGGYYPFAALRRLWQGWKQRPDGLTVPPGLWVPA